MQVTDLFGTEVHFEKTPVGLDYKEMLLLLAIEKTEGWEERLTPLQRIEQITGRPIMVYEEEKVILVHSPLNRATDGSPLKLAIMIPFKAKLREFFYHYEIVPQGKVIPFKQQ